MKICVCVDGSTNAEKAFDQALQIKRPEDELFVVCGFQFIEETTGFLSTAMVEKFVVDENTNRKASAEKVISHYKERCEKEKVSAHLFYVGGPSVKDALVDKINELEVDVCVVGSRGLGAIKRMLMGSVSNYLVHHCNCDVLVVKME